MSGDLPHGADRDEGTVKMTTTVSKSWKGEHRSRVLTAAGGSPEDVQELERLIQVKKVPAATCTALDDLGWLYVEGLREITLQEKAARVLAEVANCVPLTHPVLLMYVDDEVEELLSDAENREEFGYCEEEAAALVKQLRQLNSLERFALGRTVRAASELSETPRAIAATCRQLGLQLI